MEPCEDKHRSSHIGLIAGGGQFPLLFTQKARANGYKVVGVGFRSETDPQVARLSHRFEWLYLGQLSKLIRYFKSHGVTRVLLMGSISKSNIFKDIRPDFKALAFIAKTAGTMMTISFQNLRIFWKSTALPWCHPPFFCRN